MLPRRNCRDTFAAVRTLLLLTLLGGALPGQAAIPDSSQCARVSDSRCVLYDVSMIQLIGNPAAYHGRNVRVVGYLHLEFEGNAIYLHREDFERSISRNGLWVSFGDGAFGDRKVGSNEYVLVEGRFDAKMRGHLALWSGAILDIRWVSRWRP